MTNQPFDDARGRLLIRLLRIVARLCGIPTARYDAAVARMQTLAVDELRAEHAKALAELADRLKRQS